MNNEYRHIRVHGCMQYLEVAFTATSGLIRKIIIVYFELDHRYLATKPTNHEL